MTRPAMLTLAVLLAVAVGPAMSKVLFPLGGSWKYEDSGSDLGTGWTAVDFNDAGWQSGDGQLGFGDRDEATVLTGNTVQFYFRRTFTIFETEGYQNAVVSIVRDDGAVVYVNGQEIGRTNMPEGEVSFGTKAVEALSGADESTPVPFNIPNELLRLGANVIAVSLHNASPTSSDMSFDGALEADVAPSPSPPPPTSFDSETFPRNSDWKYLDTGADPSSEAWTVLGYDDSAWQEGPGKLGYSDTPNTEIARNGNAAFFRRRFEVEYAARVEKGYISALRDDGVVCYVNGAEIMRDNMPAGAIDINTLASSGVSHGAEVTYTGFLEFDPSVLQDGTNLVACSVHQSSATSSDLAFDAEMKMALTIEFTPPEPSATSSPVAAPSPSASPAASPAGTDPSPSPSPASGGTDPSATPSAGAAPSPSSSPAAAAASTSPTASPSTGAPASASPTPSPIAGSGTCECSCSCLESCAAGDPRIEACKSDSSSGSNTTIIVVAVVLVVAAVAGVGFFAVWRKRQQGGKGGKAAAGGGAAATATPHQNPMLLTNGDVETGDGTPSKSKPKASSTKDKERSSRGDKERSSSRRHRDDKERSRSSKDKDRSSSRRHRDDKERSSKDKERSSSRRHRDDKERSSKDKERSSSRRPRDDKERSSKDKDRSSSRRHRDDKERSSKDKERSSSRRHRDDKERSSKDKERSSRRSRSPRKVAN